MHVILKDLKVEVEIIHKDNKNIYFRIRDNRLVITCSPFVPKREIEKLIKKNEDSLYHMYQKEQKRQERGVCFTYLGKPLVKVYDETLKSVTIDDDFIYLKDEKTFVNWYKKECLKIFGARIEYWLPSFPNIPKFSLRIRQMRTRWGVNNVTKCIITLNSELLKYDVSLIDYVIVHELCHFYEANHSSRFWDQVSIRYPDYKMARKKLRS